MISPHILLAEDDESLGFMLEDNLNAWHYKISRYADGQKAITSFFNHQFDLCILDVMLPGQDGFGIAEQIRKINPSVPIIFLTAKNLTKDKIKGFDLGADDYITKPFSIDELKCRVRAVLNRSFQNAGNHIPGILNIGNTSLHIHHQQLTVLQQQINLTYKETKLLSLFFRHPNQLINRAFFLESVWQEDGFFVARSMDVFISRLRKYLKPDSLLRIDNIRGVGYMLRVSAASPS